MAELIEVEYVPTGRLVVNHSKPGRVAQQAVFEDLDEAVRFACALLRPEWGMRPMGNC